MAPSQHTPTTASEPPRHAYLQDMRPLVAFDWSTKAVHATFDGTTIQVYATIDELVGTLTRPHRLVCESTFESWDTSRRADIVDRIRASGHELYVFRPDYTAKQRRRNGTNKSTANDVKAIWQIADERRFHLYPARRPDPDWNRFVEEANRRYNKIRLNKEKGLLASAAAAILGKHTDLDDETREVLGSARGYTESVLAAVYWAALCAANRDQYERLLGLHGSAHPTLLRSEIHHHKFRRTYGTVEMRQNRRVLRRVYQQVKAAGAQPPAGLSAAPVTLHQLPDE